MVTAEGGGGMDGQHYCVQDIHSSGQKYLYLTKRSKLWVVAGLLMRQV